MHGGPSSPAAYVASAAAQGVHEVAQRLDLDDEATEAAVRRAIEHGWFIADANPPHSVRLSAVATQLD